MLIKSNAIERLLRENPELSERRFGLPSVGSRPDLERFNPTVQNIADAIDFYGYKVRDEIITTVKDTDLGNGNPMNYKPFPMCINKMKKKNDIFFNTAFFPTYYKYIKRFYIKLKICTHKVFISFIFFEI